MAQPTLNKAPDGAAAYQAMSLAQARRWLPFTLPQR